jgi:hypothetical protein
MFSKIIIVLQNNIVVTTGLLSVIQKWGRPNTIKPARFTRLRFCVLLLTEASFFRIKHKTSAIAEA